MLVSTGGHATGTEGTIHSFFQAAQRSDAAAARAGEERAGPDAGEARGRRQWGKSLVVDICMNQGHLHLSDFVSSRLCLVFTKHRQLMSAIFFSLGKRPASKPHAHTADKSSYFVFQCCISC